MPAQCFWHVFSQTQSRTSQCSMLFMANLAISVSETRRVCRLNSQENKKKSSYSASSFHPFGVGILLGRDQSKDQTEISDMADILAVLAKLVFTPDSYMTANMLSPLQALECRMDMLFHNQCMVSEIWSMWAGKKMLVVECNDYLFNLNSEENQRLK